MIPEQDKDFLGYIKMHGRVGYGRMMQIISYEWHEQLKREHKGTEDGAMVANTCVAFLSEEEKRQYLVGLESEKMQGMDY